MELGALVSESQLFAILPRASSQGTEVLHCLRDSLRSSSEIVFFKIDVYLHLQRGQW